MRKFKCVKEYPGSCKLGEVLKEYNIESQVYYKSNDGHLVYHTNVEDYPEFFEEIKEVKLDVPIGTKFKGYDDDNIYTIDHIDNSIVQICLDGITLYSSGFEVEYVNIQFKLGNWIIYKEPLFLDELGNELYKGDKYYFVVEYDRAIIPDAWEVREHVIDWDNPNKPMLGKVQFKYREDAEKYIDDNKPRFSKKQVLNALKVSKIDFKGIDLDGAFQGDILKIKLGL